LLQGLADGYFVLPQTISHYLAGTKRKPVSTDHAAFEESEADVQSRVQQLLRANGKRSVESLHQELGRIMWDHCGMARNEEGLTKGIEMIAELRERFWREARVPGENEEYNMALERALRVADFMEFADVLCRDALARNESCGAHFREEYQTPDGEAVRDDDKFCNVTAWEFKGVGIAPDMHVEPLKFENVQLAIRSYN
jgi:succinate dehydrogenase / fumarate reductase flavoprotein subunit